MGKDISKLDLDSILGITRVAEDSLVTKNTILVSKSLSAKIVGDIVGGETKTLLLAGGVSTLAKSRIGASALGSIGIASTGTIATSSAAMLGSGVAAGGIGIAIAIILWLLNRRSEEEKKLAERLKKAIEVQNRVIEQINEKLKEYEKYKDAAEASEEKIKKLKEKLLELIAINDALVKEIKRLKVKYEID